MATRRYEVAQRPATDALVHLYDLDLSLYGGGTFHWTNGPMNSQSANQLDNPCCQKNTGSWFFYGNQPPNITGIGSLVAPAYTLRGFGNAFAQRSSGLTAGGYMDIGTNWQPTAFTLWPTVPAGQWVEAQCRVQAHRCSISLLLLFIDGNGQLLGATGEGTATAFTQNGGGPGQAREVDDYTLLFAQGQAPAGTKHCQLVLRARGIGGGAAANPFVFWSMAQVATIYGPTARPLPFLPPDAVGLVKFGGVEYRPVPLELSGIQTTGQGPIPRPKVKVPNVGNFARLLMGTYRDLIRGKITRRRTFRRFLDGQPESDPSEWFGPDIWYIDRIANASPESVTFELASPLDIQGKKLPGRQVIRDICTHTYRVWQPGGGFKMGSCPYAGGAFYTPDGIQTGDPAADSCGRMFTDCGLRFPYPATLPTRAFPGSVRNRT